MTSRLTKQTTDPGKLLVEVEITECLRPPVKRIPLYLTWPDTTITRIEPSMIQCPKGHPLTEFRRN